MTAIRTVRRAFQCYYAIFVMPFLQPVLSLVNLHINVLWKSQILILLRAFLLHKSSALITTMVLGKMDENMFAVLSYCLAIWASIRIGTTGPLGAAGCRLRFNLLCKGKGNKKVCQPSQSYILSSTNRMRLPPSIIYSWEVLRSEPFHRKSFLWYLQRLFVQLEFLARFPG